jgi:hypothetical protein
MGGIKTAIRKGKHSISHSILQLCAWFARRFDGLIVWSTGNGRRRRRRGGGLRGFLSPSGAYWGFSSSQVTQPTRGQGGEGEGKGKARRRRGEKGVSSIPLPRTVRGWGRHHIAIWAGPLTNTPPGLGQGTKWSPTKRWKAHIRWGRKHTSRNPSRGPRRRVPSFPFFRRASLPLNPRSLFLSLED